MVVPFPTRLLLLAWQFSASHLWVSDWVLGVLYACKLPLCFLAEACAVCYLAWPCLWQCGQGLSVCAVCHFSFPSFGVCRQGSFQSPFLACLWRAWFLSGVVFLSSFVASRFGHSAGASGLVAPMVSGQAFGLTHHARAFWHLGFHLWLLRFGLVGHLVVDGGAQVDWSALI